jgi:hypothetical protein
MNLDLSLSLDVVEQEDGSRKGAGEKEGGGFLFKEEDFLF